PRVGESLVLGGKRWTIDGVDESSGQVWVSPGSGGSVPVFRSGGEEVHDAVRQAMRKVLAGDAVPEYLDDEAKDLLAEARRWAVPVLADPVVALDEEETALMTWCGDRTLATLDAMFELRGLKAVPE